MSRSMDETDARSPHPTRFSITNFKAFGATQEIPLAPITLIFGENSSGKSSIIQALGLIAQSFHGPGRALVPWKEEGLVDLGSLNSMLHASPGNVKPSRSMDFKLDFPIDTVVDVSSSRLESMDADGLTRALTSCRCDGAFDLYFDFHEMSRPTRRHTFGYESGELMAHLSPASPSGTWGVTYAEQDGSIRPVGESVNFGPRIEFKREIDDRSSRPDLPVMSSARLDVFDLMRKSAFEHAMFLMPLIHEVIFILLGETLKKASPEQCSQRVQSLYEKLNLDRDPMKTLDAVKKSIDCLAPVEGIWCSAFENVMESLGMGTHAKEMPDEGVAPFPALAFSEFEELYRAYSERPWGVSRNYQYLDDGEVPDDVDHEEEHRKAGRRTRPLIESCAKRHGRTIRDVVCAFTLGLIYRNAVEALIDPRCSRAPYGGRNPQSGIRDSFRVVQGWSKSVSAVGPLRATPERMTRVRGEHYGSGVDPRGESIPELLYTKKRWLRRLNDWFERLGVPYEISPRKVGFDGLDAFEIRLIEKRAGEENGIEVSWSDVGYGISQVIPVIMQSLLTRKGTILIEQPEIHLHPALQARLADLFIESACPSEDDDSSDRQFIIETHSEHLILRMIRRVREGTLDPADLSIIYVERDGLESRIVPIRIDSRGKFMDPWPGGFFPERAEELFAKMPESDAPSKDGDEA